MIVSLLTLRKLFRWEIFLEETIIGNTVHIFWMGFLGIDQCDIWSSKRSSSQSSHAWVTILYTPIRATGIYGDMGDWVPTNLKRTDYAEQIGLSPPKSYKKSIRFCTSLSFLVSKIEKIFLYVIYTFIPCPTSIPESRVYTHQDDGKWICESHQFLADNLTLFTTN